MTYSVVDFQLLISCFYIEKITTSSFILTRSNSVFDHDKFWEWVMDHSDPVYVSEYAAPKNVHVIMAVNKKARLAATGDTHSVEKMFANDAGRKAMNG